jgi:VCBS repeat-containing protein
MEFTGDTFVYTVRFAEELLGDEGQFLIHLKGTYRYTVDLANKAVSLVIEDL